MKFHTFSNATMFFDDVGAVDIIEGGHRRPWRSIGVGGNCYNTTESVSARTMTIVLLLSSAACDSHAFTF
jgi:hypothetical protein